MSESFSLVSFFSTAQWVVAFLFVPLVCWYEWSRSTLVCRWCALVTGYIVQMGLVVALIDSGFSLQAVIMLASVAAYAWIKLMTGWLPTERKASASS